jgi:L-lysine 2,3-aminomutase
LIVIQSALARFSIRTVLLSVMVVLACFCRHCERSEAIHGAAMREWIASSLRSSQ